MIWEILILSLGLAAAGKLPYVEPEYLEFLRATGRDEEFARLLGVDVNLVRSNNTGQRSGDPIFNNVSPLGDILIPEEQERQGMNFRRFARSRWPNGRIPYSITNADFTRDQIRTIEDALTEFNRRVATAGGRVRLERRGNNDRDYVQVISGNGCYSSVGKVGNQQVISLQANGCLRRGTIQHEFMHAVGFTHEQNRPDRDDYVNVLWNNIPRNWHSQYNRENANDYMNIGQYDYYSVMHYGIGSPDGSGRDAFRILRRGINRNRVGQRDGLSNSDVAKINTLYRM